MEDADSVRAALISRVRKAITWCYELIEHHGQRIGSPPNLREHQPEHTTIAFARILSSIGLADHASQIPLGAYKTHQDIIGLLHRYVPILKQYAEKLTPKIDPVHLTSFPIPGAVSFAPAEPPVNSESEPAFDFPDKLQKAEEKTTSDDTAPDEPKKPEKPRYKRAMTVAAADCARIYKAAKRKDPGTKMKYIVEEYVETNGGSAQSIIRILNDNSDQWKARKDDKKTT